MQAIRLFLVMVLLFAFAACGAEQARGPTVLAAASLQEAVGEVADAWAQEGNARPVLSFAGTPALARQVEAGAPADLILSADEQWMDELERGGFLRDGTRRDLLGNTLVLVTARDAARGQGWSEGESLTALVGDARLAVADTDSVPAGRYARAALESMREWAALERALVPAENVRAALALVERGQTEFGIVYATDAQASERVTVLGTFPARFLPPVRYPVARLEGSTNPDAARFLAYLGSPRARAIFERHGFEMVD